MKPNKRASFVLQQNSEAAVVLVLDSVALLDVLVVELGPRFRRHSRTRLTDLVVLGETGRHRA